MGVGVRIRLRKRIRVGVGVGGEVRLEGLVLSEKNKENITNRMAKLQLREVRVVGIPI